MWLLRCSSSGRSPARPFEATDHHKALISTAAKVTAGGASGANSDLLLFDATSLGAVTSGSFTLRFDGSDVASGSFGTFLDLSALGISSAADVGSVELVP